MAKEDFGQRTEVHTPNGEVLLMDAVSQEERVLEWTFFHKNNGRRRSSPNGKKLTMTGLWGLGACESGSGSGSR